jgi:hypothetical protein
MPDDTTTIRGQATIGWHDQVRYQARPYAQALSTYAAIMVLVFGAVWAFTLPDEGWIALRRSRSGRCSCSSPTPGGSILAHSQSWLS